MNAQTFFGYDSGSNMYDTRRHLNILFMNFLDYNLSLYNYQDMDKVKRAVELRETDESAAARYVSQNLLSPQQMQFLRFFKDRYQLSDDEFTTILSGISITSKISKSPAGYTKEENLILIAQLIIATAFVRQADAQIQKYFQNVAGLSSGMRGPITQNDFFHLMDVTQTECDRYYDDLLRNYDSIESYIKKNV